MNNNSKIVILISPLDWGIGHATRLIPVISILIRNKFEVILGVSGLSGKFLLEYFPQLPSAKLTSFTLNYNKGNLFVKVLFRLPRFFICMIKEHLVLANLIKERQIDCVISDNRYGLWNKKIYSVLITHQPYIKLPSGIKFLQPFTWAITGLMIQKFNKCWIPDIKNISNSISGELSHRKNMPKRYRYIGLLSRFNRSESFNAKNSKKYKLLIILSGPEPQRTIFENIIVNQIRSLKVTAIIFRGLPDNNSELEPVNRVKILNNATDDDFITFISQAEHIICRSGYSTLMDLISLQKTALLVPTPGQTEQEYLADYLVSKGMFLARSQKEFNLSLALEDLEDFKNRNSFHPASTKNLFEDVINELRNTLSKLKRL